MGDFIGVYKFDTSKVIGSDRVGTAGAARLVAEHFIAGWSCQHGVDPTLGARARRWFVYRGTKHKLTGNGVKTLKGMRMALSDDTDDCSWVEGRHFGNYYHIQRTPLEKLPRGSELEALVALWHMTVSFSEFNPLLRITDVLALAVLRGTQSLEKYKSPFATKCRRICDIIQQGAGKDVNGYVSLG